MMFRKLELLIPPPFVMLLGALLAWRCAQVFPSFQFQYPYGKVLLLVFGIVGALLGVSGILTFKKAATTINPLQPEATTHLVTTGVYQMSRNPMYVGLLFFLLGLVCFLGNVMSLLGIFFFILYMEQFQIKPEEEILRKKFGEKYVCYMHSTRRWL